MVTKDKQWWTFKVLGPSMIYNGFNREISFHCITASPRHHISQSFAFPLPPSQSVIWLAPCHQTSQSFDLASTTTSPHHHVTTSPGHHITTSVSFALPPVTKPVSHLPCPLPPNQSVIWLGLYHHFPASPCHHITRSPYHHITTSVSHLPCPL